METKNLIYAVDDEASIRELYVCALESAGFCAECFPDAEGLFSALKNKLPDLVLLDVMLDGIDGYQILERLKNDGRFSAIPVLMVSAKGEEWSKVKGLNLGADDYIAKPFGVLELVARVKANLRKTVQRLSPETEYKELKIDDGKHEITCCNAMLSLTRKEYNLLKLLIQNNNKVLLRDDILNAVWGADYFGETRTLDMHVKELRKKIANGTAEIATIRCVGFMLK